MKTLLAIARRQFVGILALAVALSGLAVAATGEPLLLGRTNTATVPTIVTNQGAGPALDLRSKKTSAPLSVSSRKLVAKLNADLLDGKHAKAFAKAGAVYTKALSDQRYAPKGGSYTKAESDARFVGPADVVLEISPATMVTNDGDLLLYTQTGNDVTQLVATTSPGSHDVAIPITAPLSVFGIPLRAESVMVCYAVSDAATKIDHTRLVLVHPGGTTVLGDGTDRNSTEIGCYTTDVGGAAWLDGSPALVLTLNFASAAHVLEFWRIQLVLRPSDLQIEGMPEGG